MPTLLPAICTQLHPASRACVLIPCATYGLGVGGRTSFWDKAIGWYLAGGFKDMPTGFVHIEDLARWGWAALAACRGSGLLHTG